MTLGVTIGRDLRGGRPERGVGSTGRTLDNHQRRLLYSSERAPMSISNLLRPDREAETDSVSGCGVKHGEARYVLA